MTKRNPKAFRKVVHFSETNTSEPGHANCVVTTGVGQARDSDGTSPSLSATGDSDQAADGEGEEIPSQEGDEPGDPSDEVRENGELPGEAGEQPTEDVAVTPVTNRGTGWRCSRN